ncbi:unnamed protein product [Paramecium octaurelia]|uniref:Transmembrane protein n=1 Tax=Paramecium octaurelia TaxID=43137 RepID=A0A8S1XKG3_PAROT|nr:unnamed protein product [Paramecium octaurelia]
MILFDHIITMMLLLLRINQVLSNVVKNEIHQIFSNTIVKQKKCLFIPHSAMIVFAQSFLPKPLKSVNKFKMSIIHQKVVQILRVASLQIQKSTSLTENLLQNQLNQKLSSIINNLLSLSLILNNEYKQINNYTKIHNPSLQLLSSSTMDTNNLRIILFSLLTKTVIK